MSIGLYWCTTENGDSDFWVVADSPAEARDYFSVVNGFHWGDVNAKRVKTVHPGLIVTLGMCIPCDPTKAQLEGMGVKYNSNFHVFYIGQKIYRPESIVRHLMVTHAKRARIARLRGQRVKRSSLRLVGPSST